MESNPFGAAAPVTTRGERIYSAPRRYDLATMFVVSVAYAALFAAMRLLGAAPGVFLMTGLFFTGAASPRGAGFAGGSLLSRIASTKS